MHSIRGNTADESFTVMCDAGYRSSAGSAQFTVACQNNGMFNTTHCVALCGDHRVHGDEECDDGNLASGDGCDDHCIIEPGFSCWSDSNGTQDCTNSCSRDNICISNS